MWYNSEKKSKLLVLHVITLLITLVACQQNTASDTTPTDNAPILERPTISVHSCGGLTPSNQQNACDTPKEYCHREIKDMCGAADAPGVCRIRPEICTQEYAPVCGCDGKTYSNACVANGHGVSVMAIGECS